MLRKRSAKLSVILPLHQSLNDLISASFSIFHKDLFIKISFSTFLQKYQEQNTNKAEIQREQSVNCSNRGEEKGERLTQSCLSWRRKFQGKGRWEDMTSVFKHSVLLQTVMITYVSGQYSSKGIKLQQARPGLDIKNNVQVTVVLKEFTEAV